MTTDTLAKLAPRLSDKLLTLLKCLPEAPFKEHLTAELEALAAQALPAAEPVAWTVAGEVTNWARDFSKYRTQHYVRPVYTAPQATQQAAQSTTGGGVTAGAPSEPFGYFKAEPFGWTDCAETDDGAVALYERPQQAAQAPAGWQPIETAPRGNGDDPSIKLVTDPRWIEPLMVLLLFRGGETAVGRWDWYYADGGSGRIDGCAWVEPTSGEVLSRHYDPPTHWMPLPQPQPQSAQAKGDA